VAGYLPQTAGNHLLVPFLCNTDALTYRDRAAMVSSILHAAFASKCRSDFPPLLSWTFLLSAKKVPKVARDWEVPVMSTVMMGTVPTQTHIHTLTHTLYSFQKEVLY